ncbi:unnamed protein product [Prorocentrum cordatum]|uniref:Uncharacterized protein n=1 Tax=Prorocentrum cordatum TaxID=2364126 RepID=A0ABN9SLP9_9DINO|nr:unnamed protein product [Polarella glacialis]
MAAGTVVGLAGSVGLPVKGGVPQWSSTCYGHVGDKACHKTNKCSCTSGCIGADGSCYSENNQVIADGFSLYNAKWPTYYLYFQSMSVFGQMKVSNSRFTMGQDKFTLLQPPGQGTEKEFFMASHKWPQSMVSLQQTGFTELSLWGTYAMNVKTDHEPWDLEKVLLRVCMPATFPNKTKNTKAITFGLSKKQGGFPVWSYVADKHWLAQGFWAPEQMVSELAKHPGKLPSGVATGPPGDNGYWIPEPAFPKGAIPAC